MTGTPRVSVVMSVYNDVERVESAVRGILGQTLRELELIVIDDGSSDGSGELLDRLANEDPRLRVIHQQNAGLTRSLVLGCNEARGEFIARQDSDDWSHPSRLEEQAKLLESDARVGFVSCTTQYVGPDDEHLSITSRPSDPETATRGLLGPERLGPPAHGSVMFRKTLYDEVGGYRPEFHFAQDSDLWLRMGMKSRIAYLPDVRYTYRQQIRSTSGRFRSAQQRFGELGQDCLRARQLGLPEDGYLEQARQLTERLRSGGDAVPADNQAIELQYLLGSQLVRNRDARAVAYLRQVVRSRPWHWKAWIRLMQAVIIPKPDATAER
ncbi:glycosyltransferase family 2 protein [Arenimonas sp.]|uniref:glycosyltransferase family 2 protein n=1 Tax=Arenimonas sp. TaxID=1872635 RepID=UPI0039E2A496